MLASSPTCKNTKLLVGEDANYSNKSPPSGAGLWPDDKALLILIFQQLIINNRLPARMTQVGRASPPAGGSKRSSVVKFHH